MLRQLRHLLFALCAIGIFSVGSLLIHPAKASASAGINSQLSFEGKIVKSDGTNIADGTYNMEFKIYQDGTNAGVGSTLKWTEDYLVSASQAVTVTSGTFQVNLGSITAFGGSVDWNQSVLWLSMQVGSTSSCTPAGNFTTNCTGDGEMTPYIRLTSSPYALNAGQLGGIAASGFVQLSPGSQQTGNINVSGTVNSNTFTGSSLQFGSAGTATLQSASSQALTITANAASTWSTSAGNLTIQAAGTNALTLDTGGAGTVNVGNTNATAIVIGGNTSGTITQKVATSSTTAFLLQSTVSILTADTTNSKLIVGSASSTPILLVLASKNDNSTDPTEVNGALYYNSSSGNFRCGVSGIWENCIGGLLSSNTSLSSAVNNCTNCASFSVNSAWPANYCVPGRVIQVTASGTYSATGATPHIGFGVYLGSNASTKGSDTQLGPDTTTVATVGSNQGWSLNFYIICDTSGSSGTVNAQGYEITGKASGGADVESIDNGAAITVNTTLAQTLYIFPSWTVANAANTSTLHQLIVTGM